MINIKIDPYGLSKEEPNDLIVREELKFIESRLNIREALRKKKRLNVIIKNSKIGKWYESLKEYSNINIEFVSYGSVLSQLLKFPSSLTLNLPLKDSEIGELGLITKAKAQLDYQKLATSKDLENWILSVCIDECWSKKGGTLSHLSEMVSFFLQGRDRYRHSVLEKLLENQKFQWYNSPIGEAYKWLLTSPNDRAFLIYTWQILKNYDNVLREKTLNELLKNDQNIYKPIEEYLGQIPSCECSNEYEKKSELSDIIEIKLKNILRSRLRYKKSEIKGNKNEESKQRFKEIISDLIPKLSGNIAGEINALLDFVSENPLYFCKELFNLIAAKFILFPKQIENLSQLIPPEIPSEPLPNWNWNKISEWAENEYFPYIKWTLRQERRDREIKNIVEKYSDWLYRNYPELKNDLFPLIYGIWYKIKKYIQEGYQILWIIIDNLPWVYLEDIIKAFKEQGLHCHLEPTLCLSMLPSETKISKTALVAGKLPNQIELNNYQKYELLFEKFCKENNIESYRSIPDKIFRKSKLERHQISCCIINKLDLSSHGGFFDYDDEIKSFIERIAKYVKNFLPADVAFTKFYTIISTDHGSCAIPPNIKGLKKPKGTKAELDYKRFAYIESGSALDENWYFLEKNKFGLMEDVAIVKDYYFIGNTKPKGLVHGGMTPEETLVPYLEFCLKPIDIKAVQCFHISPPIPLGTRKHKVQLSIRNLNDHEISNVILYIPSHSIELNVESIPKKDEVIQTFEIAISKEELENIRENVANLQGFYGFDCLGETRRGKVDLIFKIRKIVDVSETAEEFFNI